MRATSTRIGDSRIRVRRQFRLRLRCLKAPCQKRAKPELALGAVGKDEAVVETLVSSLEGEADTTARDSLIVALGELRNRKAVPALASIVKNIDDDGETRHLAACSLGRIVRKRFGKQADPIAAAIEWLDRHEETGDSSGSDENDE
jgi:HEAT repeat protein